MSVFHGSNTAIKGVVVYVHVAANIRPRLLTVAKHPIKQRYGKPLVQSHMVLLIGGDQYSSSRQCPDPGYAASAHSVFAPFRMGASFR